MKKFVVVALLALSASTVLALKDPTPAVAFTKVPCWGAYQTGGTTTITFCNGCFTVSNTQNASSSSKC